MVMRGAIEKGDGQGDPRKKLGGTGLAPGNGFIEKVDRAPEQIEGRCEEKTLTRRKGISSKPTGAGKARDWGGVP